MYSAFSFVYFSDLIQVMLWNCKIKYTRKILSYIETSWQVEYFCEADVEGQRADSTQNLQGDKGLLSHNPWYLHPESSFEISSSCATSPWKLVCLIIKIHWDIHRFGDFSWVQRFVAVYLLVIRSNDCR